MKEYVVKVTNRPVRVFANYSVAHEFAGRHGVKVKVREHAGGCKSRGRYYVYVKPGWIEYFDDFGEANDFAVDHGLKVQDIEISIN